MKRLTICAAIVTVISLSWWSPAFPWASLTHVYIGQELDKQSGPLNLDEVYGITAPDAFNYLFTPPFSEYRDYLYEQTHFEFMKLWDGVKHGYEKPIAHGFIAHNNEWGADRTAHVKSLTLLPYEGYVITKAKALHEVLMQVPEYAALGLPESVSIEVCHDIVEAAGDVVINRAIPGLGEKLVKSTLRPSEIFQKLLVEAYAPGLVDFSAGTSLLLDYETAAQVILLSEAGFRSYMATYGWVFQQDEQIIMQGIIADFESMARAYLEALGSPLPSEVDIKPLIEFGLSQAIGLCEYDYLEEVQATIQYVDRQMKMHKINRNRR